MNKKLKICFLGSPLFAVPSLKELKNSGHDLLCVMSQPPRPANRGNFFLKQPVQEFAEKNNIEVFCPNDLNSPEVFSYLSQLELDMIIVVAYGKIIPKKILELPVFGCVNLHASLLPRWRGAAPIQRAIMNGDSYSGITIMLMNESLDTGPVLNSLKIKINESDNYLKLANLLSIKGAILLKNTIIDFVSGKIIPKKQSLEGITYANKILRKDEIIDWKLSNFLVFKKIKSLSPIPGAKSKLKGEVVKIIDAELFSSSVDEEAGTVFTNDLCIKCGNEAIKVLSIQRPGKKILSSKDVLNGWPISAGTKMELLY